MESKEKCPSDSPTSPRLFEIFPNVVKSHVPLMSGGEGGILLYTIVVPKFFLRFAISKEVNTHSYLGLFGPSEFL